MHNSFLACVLSYHKLKRENTSTFSHSEIMWSKVYLIFLLSQKRNSLVKSWVYMCLRYQGFHLPHSFTNSSSPACCQMPGDTNPQLPTMFIGDRPGLNFSTRLSLCSALTADPLLLQEIL